MRDADPAAGPEYDGWADSDAGQRVFERIVSRRDEPEKRSLQSRRGLRPIVAASLTFVVIALVLVGVVAWLPSPADEVAQSTTSTSVDETPVDRVQALAMVVELASPSSAVEHPSPPIDEAGDMAMRAARAGILAQTDVEWASSHGSLTRAMFCQWVARGFSGRLPEEFDYAPADMDGLPPVLRDAVVQVVNAGVLALDSEGLFHPEQPLSRGDFEKAMRLLEKMLGF